MNEMSTSSHVFTCNHHPGSAPPRKPWEQSGGSSGPTPFNPPSAGSTSEIVEASGTSRPGEFVSPTESNAAANRNPAGRPVPSRPWTSNYGNAGSTLGGSETKHSC